MNTSQHKNASDQPRGLGETPADRALVEALVANQVIDQEIRRDLFTLIYPRQNTQQLILRSFLLLAALFFTFGCSSIVAANWQNIGYVLRIGMPQCLMVISLAGAAYFGLENFKGKLLAAVATVSIAATLIILSQEFQLNADSPWLFGRWLLLALPIVICARFLPLWWTWIVVLNFFIYVFTADLWANDNGRDMWFAIFEYGESFVDVVSWAFILTGLGFVFLQHFIIRANSNSPKWDWLRPTWPRFLLLLWIQFWVVWNISYYYAGFLFNETPVAWSLIMIAAHIALLLSVQIGLRKLRQVDMWSVAVSTLALGLQATIVVVTTLVHTIAEFKTDHDYWMVIMFFSAAATFVIFGVCATYLWKLRSNDSLPSLDSASPPRNEDSSALEQSTEVHPSAKQ